MATARLLMPHSIADSRHYGKAIACQDTRQTREKNYYQVLGVDPKASVEDINKAYRAKMQVLHPDKTASWATKDVPKEVKDFLTDTARQLNLAYEILSNPEKRGEYDQRIGG